MNLKWSLHQKWSLHSQRQDSLLSRLWKQRTSFLYPQTTTLNIAKANINIYPKSQFTVRKSKVHHLRILKEVVKKKKNFSKTSSTDGNAPSYTWLDTAQSLACGNLLTRAERGAKSHCNILVSRQRGTTVPRGRAHSTEAALFVFLFFLLEKLVYLPLGHSNVLQDDSVLI